MKLLLVFFASTFLFWGTPAFADEPSISALKQITQAGGSLILDMEKQRYSVAQLIDLASSLKYQSTLTIKVGKGTLSIVQCTQIARARPGQVIFWF